MSLEGTPYRVRHAALSLTKEWRISGCYEVIPYIRLYEGAFFRPDDGPMGSIWWKGERFDLSEVELCEPAPVFAIAPGRREYPDGRIEDVTEEGT